MLTQPPSIQPTLANCPITQPQPRQPTRLPHLKYPSARDPSLKNIQVIIPAQDEAEAIAPVIRSLQRTGLSRILVIDNGRQGNTAAIARAVELGLRIAEIPVGDRDRQGGKSKISGMLKGSFQAGTIILTTLDQLYWQQLI